MLPGVLLRPEGVLDAPGCGILRRQLSEAFTRGEVHVVLDLRDVTDVELPGWELLGAVSTFLRRRGGGLVVTHLPLHLRGKLAVNELGHVLKIWPQVPADDPEPLSEVIVLADRRRRRAASA